ncbi:MAG: alpha-amylase [Bacteroidales bacterium]|nr:alpha-amylase [Bacteroidales bacterium]
MPGKRIIYQVLPRLWNDGSTFCGKFSSFGAETFSYLKSLGVSDIWYTGVIRHATRLPGFENAAPECVKGTAGSPYAITDYYDVNPYLADDPSHRMEEFEALVRRTHEAGFRVIIDFVPNHVARQYDGSMTPAGTPRLGSRDDVSVHWKAENDFFYYPGEALRLPVAGSYQEFPAKASGNCFSPAPDADDWYDTVKLNYCPFYTSTWERMAEIIRFWALRGVDGFRCDMVELVPPEFFTWLIRNVKKEFPELTFIAEVYEKALYERYVREVGFDLLYDKSGMYDTLRDVVARRRSAAAITDVWQYLGDLQPSMLNFLENHDEQRIASPEFAGSPEAGLAALGVSLLFNTAPFMLYFGQELGEKGERPGGRTSIFDLTPVPSLAALPVIPSPAGASVSPVLARYRALLGLAALPVFAEGGTWDLCYCQGPGFDRTTLFAWLRSDGEALWLCLSNFSDRKVETDITIPAEAFTYFGFPPQSKILTVVSAPRDCTVARV